MSIHEHNRRSTIFGPHQHPYAHDLADFPYTNSAYTGTNIESALNWIFAVLYPNTQDSVATPAALPGAGNTINDMRVVLDDGDGKPASYRWEQREGDVAPEWKKIYDMDWGEDSILSGFLNKTSDVYVYKYGYDDLDEAGAPIAGDLAGQHIYGGASAGTHLTLYANSGDGVGADTGWVQFGDQVRPTDNNAIDLGTAIKRFKDIRLQGRAYIGTMDISDGQIVDSSGAISFGNENLSTTGTMTVDSTLINGAVISNTTGQISFADENLLTTGTVTADSVSAVANPSSFKEGTNISNLIFETGQIRSTSGQIAFDDENLTTNGDMSAVNLRAGTEVLVGGTAVVIGVNSFAVTNDGYTFSLDGPAERFNFANGVDFLGAAFTGTVTVTGELDVDNIKLNGNTISTTDTNGDLTINPDGTGKVNVSATILPGGDATYDLGASGSRWNNLYVANSIATSGQSMSMATLMSLRDINSGVAPGMSIFWNGTKWAPSIPDTEIDHGTISGLGDDDHTQYVLLAGRTGGQTIYGGNALTESLTLQSNSANPLSGTVVCASYFTPDTNGDLDLGTGSRYWKDLYLAGQAIGLRAQNTTTGATGAAPATEGRLIYDTGDSFLYVDTGGTWAKVGGITNQALTAGNYMTAPGTFDGAVARTFDVDATSANTASKVVARDGSGNFSAGTITAALTGNATSATNATNADYIDIYTNSTTDTTTHLVLVGNNATGNQQPFIADGGSFYYNASSNTLHCTNFDGTFVGSIASADKWTTARTLTLGTDLSGNVSFDGSANFTLNATVANDSHSHTGSTISGLDAGDTTSGVFHVNRIPTNITVDNADYVSITDEDNPGSVVRYLTFVPSSTTSYQTLRQDGNLSYNPSSNVLTVGSITGSAAKWTTARTLTLGTDLSGSVAFDGSANFTLNATVANDSHSHTGSTISALDGADITTGTIADARLESTINRTSFVATSTVQGQSVVATTFNTTYGAGAFRVSGGPTLAGDTNSVHLYNGQGELVLHNDGTNTDLYAGTVKAFRCTSTVMEIRNGQNESVLYNDAANTYLRYNGSNRLQASSDGVYITGETQTTQTSSANDGGFRVVNGPRLTGTNTTGSAGTRSTALYHHNGEYCLQAYTNPSTSTAFGTYSVGARLYHDNDYVAQTLYHVPSPGAVNKGLDVRNDSTAGSQGACLFFTLGTSFGRFLLTQSNNYTYFLNPAWNAGVYLQANGTSWIAFSDERLKENIVDVSTADCEKLYNITPKRFNFIGADPATESRYGFTAQDVMTQYPEMIDEADLNGFYGLNEQEIIAMLVGVVKSQNDRITALETA